MFGASSRYSAPGARYRDIEVAARVEGATPHGLILIMFDELLKGIDALQALDAAPEPARRNAAHARVISLLHGLETSLDYKRGGEIADNLGRIYREARRLLGPTPGMERGTALAQARDMLSTVSSAWEAIGAQVNGNLT